MDIVSHTGKWVMHTPFPLFLRYRLMFPIKLFRHIPGTVFINLAFEVFRIFEILFVVVIDELT